MSIINQLFETKEENIIKKLGNILISGVNESKKKLLFFDILKKYIDQNKTILITDGNTSEDEFNKLKYYISNLGKGERLFAFSSDSKENGFDVLSAFDTLEEKTDFITFLLIRKLTIFCLKETLISS